jgi:hypothetical protein
MIILRKTLKLTFLTLWLAALLLVSLPCLAAILMLFGPPALLAFGVSSLVPEPSEGP